MLVPDVDGMHARQFGKGGGPVHVAVAHQDELRVDSLRKERFCEGLVEFGHGRSATWMMRAVTGAAASPPPSSGPGMTATTVVACGLPGPHHQ